MPDVAKLRAEHGQLIAIIRRMGAMVANDAPPPSALLDPIRHELASTLMRHLQAEDWMLYPDLLDSSDPAAVETASMFSHEMGGLAADFINYVQKWGPATIERDWTGFCHETTVIADALTRRITRENQELYPLLEKRDRAA